MKIFPLIKKITTIITGGSPTFVINEVRNALDRLAFTLRLTDSKRLDDNFSLTPRFTETMQRSDVARIPSINAVINDNMRHNDTATFTLTLRAVDRSGTTDNNDWGDAWTDAGIGQTGVNHGNESPLSLSTLIAGARNAYMKINLTKYTGLTATGGTHTISFYFNNSNALSAQSVNIAMQGQAGNPFTESTITQSNQPATPAAITFSHSIPANTVAGVATFTLNDSQMNQLLGRWVLIVITGGSLLTTETSVISREGASANRATITFKALI